MTSRLTRTFLVFFFSILSFLGAGELSASDFLPESGHPRLLMTERMESAVRSGLEQTEEMRLLNAYVVRQCDELLGRPVLEYRKRGFRLLPVAREALRRIFYLSFTYRMTGDDAYADRAIREMRAVCSFPDWNPSHFLDTGEMAVAVAIGYDWLYGRLDEDTERLARKALIEKALEPSMDDRWNDFLDRVNNWNQVCNCGMVFAALALAEAGTDGGVEADSPAQDFYSSVVSRAVRTVRTSMASYAPDGAYPEGYQYWGYGTTFNVMMIAALESALGDDFGLSEMPGFMETADFMLYMCGTSGIPFNYSDGTSVPEFFPAQYWFAAKSGRPELLWNEHGFLRRWGTAFTGEEARVLPLALIYVPGNQQENRNVFDDNTNVVQPASHFWAGRGKQPMFMIRTEWEDGKGVYVAAKGGAPRTDHGHMDAGSFIFETDGIRWTEDLGVQTYDSLEEAGILLWDSHQTGDRWKIFRYTNQVHNTITVDGALHNAASFVPLDKIYRNRYRMGGRFDMTSLYPDQFRSASRTILLCEGQQLEITDAVRPSCGLEYRFTLVTGADIRLTGDGQILFHKAGKTLQVEVSSSLPYRAEVLSNDPPHRYDAPNPGTRRLVLSFRLPAGRKNILKIKLLPIR